MKPVSLTLCLTLLPLAAHASIDSSREEKAPLAVRAHQDANAAPVSVDAEATDAAAPGPRRSRMVEASASDRPVMKFSAIYHVVDADPSRHGNCLQNTGSRLKRKDNANGACPMSVGWTFKPDR